MWIRAETLGNEMVVATEGRGVEEVAIIVGRNRQTLEFFYWCHPDGTHVIGFADPREAVELAEELNTFEIEAAVFVETDEGLQPEGEHVPTTRGATLH